MISAELIFGSITHISVTLKLENKSIGIEKFG